MCSVCRSDLSIKMAPTTKKKKRPTKDAAVVSMDDEPPSKKLCTCACMNGINCEKTTNASSSKSKEPVMTRRASIVKSKAAVMLRTPRRNKGQLPSVSVPRTPITRSKQQQLLSLQEWIKPNVVHSRRDSPTVPFVRKWSKNDELRILRGLQEHRQLHVKQLDLVVVFDKITRDGSFDNQDVGIPEFKDKVHKLRCLYKKMASMKDPKGDEHKIELFRIGCNVWGDNASNAHAHGADPDADIGTDAAAPAPSTLDNDNTHGLGDAPRGAHAEVVASPDAPAPAVLLAAHVGMGAPATVGMPLLTTTSSCANSRDEDEPSQWLRVALRWGSRLAFLVAFAAFMSPGWLKGDTRSSWS